MNGFGVISLSHAYNSHSVTKQMSEGTRTTTTKNTHNKLPTKKTAPKTRKNKKNKREKKKRSSLDTITYMHEYYMKCTVIHFVRVHEIGTNVWQRRQLQKNVYSVHVNNKITRPKRKVHHFVGFYLVGPVFSCVSLISLYILCLCQCLCLSFGRKMTMHTHTEREDHSKVVYR